MSYIYLIGVSLLLLLVQTAIMPFFALFDNFYDLYIPLIVYLGLRHSIKEGLLFVILLGLLSDTLAGGSFGIFTTAYIWLFSATSWIFTFLQVKNNVLVPFIVAAGVFLENCLFIGIFFLLEPAFECPRNTTEIVLVQTIWAIVTGPPLLMAINYGMKKWDFLKSTVFAGQTGLNRNHLP